MNGHPWTCWSPVCYCEGGPIEVHARQKAKVNTTLWHHNQQQQHAGHWKDWKPVLLCLGMFACAAAASCLEGRGHFQIFAYHFIAVNVVNLLPATDDTTVDPHGLIDHAQGCAAIEAILWAMVYCVRLVNSWVLHCPGLLACQHKQGLHGTLWIHDQKAFSRDREADR